MPIHLNLGLSKPPTSLYAIPWLEARFELLGQASFGDPLAESFNFAIVGILVLGVVATIATAVISRLIEKQRLGHLDAERLLDEICRAHGFSFSQRRLIAKIALKSGLNEPGLVAIFPSAFSAACERIKPTPRLQRRLEAIRERLFGTPPLLDA